LPLAIAILCLAALGCEEDREALKEGFYTAQAEGYSEAGWKDYLTIYVNNGRIAIIEFDAVNQSGFRRSWDMDYRLEATSLHGAKAFQCYLAYESALLTLQDVTKVQPVAGARRTHQVFTALAQEAIGRSRASDKSVANVPLPVNAFPGDL
jgi:major membrane immunogen (membrane-anchored lipoprotein)